MRLIRADGSQVGVVPLQAAKRAAEDANLDLVEVSPKANPPVCKLLDYGKFKYETQKRDNEAKKRQRTISVKEIKMRPNIDTHDYAVKMRSVVRFIDDGDKVKITIRFRGRELAHPEIGENLLARIRDESDDVAKVEMMPKLEGRQMTMVMAPK